MGQYLRVQDSLCTIRNHEFATRNPVQSRERYPQQVRSKLLPTTSRHRTLILLLSLHAGLVKQLPQISENTTVVHCDRTHADCGSERVGGAGRHCVPGGDQNNIRPHPADETFCFGVLPRGSPLKPSSNQSRKRTPVHVSELHHRSQPGLIRLCLVDSYPASPLWSSRNPLLDQYRTHHVD